VEASASRRKKMPHPWGAWDCAGHCADFWELARNWFRCDGRL